MREAGLEAAERDEVEACPPDWAAPARVEVASAAGVSEREVAGCDRAALSAVEALLSRCECEPLPRERLGLRRAGIYTPCCASKSVDEESTVEAGRAEAKDEERRAERECNGAEEEADVDSREVAGKAGARRLGRKEQCKRAIAVGRLAHLAAWLKMGSRDIAVAHNRWAAAAAGQSEEREGRGQRRRQPVAAAWSGVTAVSAAGGSGGVALAGERGWAECGCARCTAKPWESAAAFHLTTKCESIRGSEARRDQAGCLHAPAVAAGITAPSAAHCR